MKVITVRLPESLARDIEAESRARSISKSDVIRERLEMASSPSGMPVTVSAIADLVGSVEGLPADLSARKKSYLKSTRYGQRRAR